MRYFLAVILSLTLFVECDQHNTDAKSAGKGPGGSGGGAGNEKPTNKRTNETNYRVCGTVAPTGATATGRWEMFESQGESDFKIGLEFLDNRLVLRQDCFNNGRRLTAQVVVPATYSNGTLKILEDASNIQKTEDNAFDCSVSIKQESSTYAYSGNCLELTNFQGRPRLLFAPQ
jgi:hypothetical protein